MKTHIDLNNKKILVTGCPGFIGSNLIGFYNILEACRHSYDMVAEGDDGAAYKGVQH